MTEDEAKDLKIGDLIIGDISGESGEVVGLPKKDRKGVINVRVRFGKGDFDIRVSDLRYFGIRKDDKN